MKPVEKGKDQGKWHHMRVVVGVRDGKQRDVWRGRAKNEKMAVELAARNYTLEPDEYFYVYFYSPKQSH